MLPVDYIQKIINNLQKEIDYYQREKRRLRRNDAMLDLNKMQVEWYEKLLGLYADKDKQQVIVDYAKVMTQLDIVSQYFNLDICPECKLHTYRIDAGYCAACNRKSTAHDL